MKRIILAITVVAMFAIPSFASAHVWPLTMAQARYVAAQRAYEFHPRGHITRVTTMSCEQWNAWRTDCDADADGKYYDYQLGFSMTSYCLDFVDVFKNPRTGQITSRVEHNMSCG